MYIDNKLVKFWKKLDNIFFCRLERIKSHKNKKTKISTKSFKTTLKNH